MEYMAVNQWLLWGGIAAMAAAGVLAVVCGVIFTITGRRLKNKLEEEYGKPQG